MSFGDSNQMDRAQAAELQQFVEEEQRKAAFQEMISRLTDTCWDKCVGKPGNSLSSSERSCLANCVERFLDTTQTIVKRLSSNK
mmetsp:Transcript_5666/g.13226  ORF Transcript_5666/g.13226 Transcript_5666/m.13226 type:complete len:84 (-) Transcript_5666:229-480(-)|eukprot:CAMPEP_0113885404 /NCGR_PEP_ID=MMETSP0780_2-20120614/10891_1 /TAXON_ID=652834 /ORGANISM="Palpitomonas bilix" /LENGTH=83 /DNA_ID=CAMNT_0000873325 /DNA_START=63 /DNA_END=314 /DNA_ORIENTATION=+ /assembly_acc=CAM_ASM_000599